MCKQNERGQRVKGLGLERGTSEGLGWGWAGVLVAGRLGWGWVKSQKN